VRKITLGHLDISAQGKRYVQDCLDSNRLSYGKYTRRFEQEFAVKHGCKHGIFLNSGTSALQVALAALKEIYNYKDGDEVIVPACTFIATSNVVLQNRLKPVFVDVDSRTFNINPVRIHDALTSRTRCILPVHLFGLSADMSPIMTIAHNYGLQVLEDSCETVGATYNGQSVGSFGDAACFSNYIAHHVVGGVGGLITTNDDRLAEISRSLLAHGRDSIYMSIDDDNDMGAGFQNIVERRYKFDRLGYSYRATELEAAIGLSELEQLESNLLTRRTNANQLINLLSDLSDKLQLPFTPKELTHSYMMFPVVVKDGVNRDKLLMYLEQEGVETRYLMPLLSQPIYRKIFPELEHKFPWSQKLARQGFFFGLHKGLTSEDIVYISDVFHNYFKAAR
jgi:dTDP-4-amino-4,6-dideoxygalactose transaminase